MHKKTYYKENKENKEILPFVSFNRNCKVADILTDKEVNINNVPDFIRLLRENPQTIFKGIKVPTVKEAADLEHGELPAIIGTGLYNCTRSNSNLTEWNRLIWLDIDCADKNFKKNKSSDFFTREINKLKSLLLQESKLYAYCLSKSGKGLRVIYRIPDVHEIENVAVYYSDVYMAFKKVIDSFMIQNNLSFFEVDPQAKDIAHPFAIVADSEAYCFNYEVDADKFKNLLTDYQLKEKKFESKHKAIIDPALVASLKIEDMQLSKFYKLDNYTSRFQAANVLSYLYGSGGLEYYLSIVEGNKKAEYKGYYNYGLNKRNSYTSDDVNMLLLSADRYFNLQLPKQYINNEPVAAAEPAQYIFKSYLSELKAAVINIINTDKKIIIDAPTNTGKTTLSKELSQYYKIDFLAPTQAIVLQQTKDIRTVVGDTLLSDEDTEASILAAPFESIGKLSQRKSNMLIIDEAHHLIADYSKGFRQKAVRNIIDSFHRYKYIILLSGTPDGLELISGFNLYKFRRENTEKVKLHDYLTFSEVVKKPGFLSIYINDKDKGHEYKKRLISDFNFTDTDIAIINSDEKATPAYQDLLNKQLLDNNIKCIIATKLIADGININNQYDKVNIYFPEVHRVSYNEIKQFSTRFRKAPIELFTNPFTNNVAVKSSFIPSLNQLEIDALRMTENILMVNTINNYQSSFENLNDSDCYFREIKENNITYDKITEIVVDEMILIRKYIDNNNLLFRNIENVRTDILKGLDIEYYNSLPVEDDELRKEINSTIKRNKKDEFLNNIENFESLLTSEGLSKGQKSLVDSYRMLVDFGVENASAKDVIKNASNKQNISRHIKSVKFNANRKLIENNTINITEIDSLPIMVILMNIYTYFKDKTDKDYTYLDFENFVNNVIDFKKDKCTGLSYIVVNSNYVMECFNIVFEMKQTRSKDKSRNAITKYKINDIKTDKYLKIVTDIFQPSKTLFDID